MQRAVHQQMGGVSLDRHMLVGRLGGADAVSKDDVAEKWSVPELRVFGHREGEDIGRVVLAPPGRVQLPNFVVRGEFDRDLAVIERSMTTVRNRGMNRPAR